MKRIVSILFAFLATTTILLLSLYASAEGVEAGFDIFVATVDLVDVVNAAGAFGTHSCNKHSYTGTNIGAGHVVMLELTRVVMPHHNRSMRVAEDDLRAHVNQFVHKEETRFEHLLMDKHRAACLRGYDQYDREQVRRETGPRRICDREN